MVKTNTLDLASLAISPEFYPLELNFAARTLTFVRMTRQTYRDSVFLDNRTIAADGERHTIRLDDILFANRQYRKGIGRAHFLLHTTFCCSTLLCRYWEQIPGCLVLKEPALLTQLGLQESLSHAERRDLLELSLLLLTRGYRPGTMNLVKPHEPFNHLAEEMLAGYPEITLTFMITPLARFLPAVLKSQFRREWVQKRMRQAVGDTKLTPELTALDRTNLSDARAAAFLWLANRWMLQRLVEGPHAGRVLALNGDVLVDTPDASLSAVFRNARQNVSASLRKTMVAAAGRQYSKAPGIAFEPVDRETDLAGEANQHRLEIEDALAWAQPHPWKLDLSDLPRRSSWRTLFS